MPEDKLIHLSKEFEIDHSGVARMRERLATLEAFVAAHPEIHRLEATVANVTKTELERRLHDMNNLRDQIDGERGTFVQMTWFEQKHKDLESMIFAATKALSDRLALLEQWQWKIIGASVAISLIFSIIAALIGWLFRFHS
jgi:hypothetical protein